MPEERRCSQCGGELPADAPQGLCPQCLMKLGLPTGAEPDKTATPDDQSAVPTNPTPPARFVPPEPAELAKQFGQLEILELLGQGGMGAVYKARQKQLDRLVALKILPPEIVGQAETFAERFTREARSLAKLNHPHIVTVHDFGRTEQGLYYFIMEFVDGTDLRRVIKAGELSPQEALAIVPQICEALQYAHEEGLVHRDIKPENILLDKKGRVRIADFGLAKLLDQTTAIYTLTQAGQKMGTPHYMAPEQFERPEQVDHRADIYSLGVVFYEMLTGELPIGRFAPPSQKVQVDVRLDNVVLRSLEKEPERRYQHASEVKTEVEMISSAGQTVLPSARLPEDIEAAHRRLRPPAVALIIAGVINACLGFLLLLVAIVLLLAMGRFSIAAQINGGLGLAFLALGIVVILGACRMTQLQCYPLAVTGSIVALVPSAGSIFGLPFGIWALIALSRSDVKAAFGRTKMRAGPADSSRQAIKQRLRVPAVALIIGGALRCAGGVLFLSLMATQGNVGAKEAILLAALMAIGAVIIVGASQMLRLRQYGLAVTSSVLAVLAVTLDLPFAIWALVVLSKPEVKAAFAQNKTKTDGSQHPSSPSPH